MTKWKTIIQSEWLQELQKELLNAKTEDEVKKIADKIRKK